MKTFDANVNYCRPNPSNSFVDPEPAPDDVPVEMICALPAKRLMN